MNIDTNFDFTSDTPNFWLNYWTTDEILGCAGNDPDIASPTLKKYHQTLWSKPLPVGKNMELSNGNGFDYLNWENFRFGSDSVTASFRYKKYRYMIEQVAAKLPNYHEFIENYVHNSYTIGGEIIFPKMRGGINQSRGCNPSICDRFDLTLECIRRFYLNEKSPLSEVLEKNKNFFELFVNFQGYVDFFLLNDMVSDDYTRIRFWCSANLFEKYPFPKTVDEYLLFIDNELTFVAERNKRIKNYAGNFTAEILPSN